MNILKQLFHHRGNEWIGLRMSSVFGVRRKMQIFTPQRITVLVLSLILAGVGIWYFSYVKGAQAAWYDANWSFRKKITIDHTKVSGTANLTDFTVLVSIFDEDLATKAQLDGDDILFTDSSGAKLSHEIELYSAGKLVAWVKVPTLDYDDNTILYMYYGNSGASSQQASDTGTVYDSSYLAVYHLAESGDATGNDYIDSKSTNDGQGGGGTSSAVPVRTSGYVGYGQSLDGTDDIVQLPAIDFGVTGGETIGTIQGWAKADTVDTTTSTAHYFLGRNSQQHSVGYRTDGSSNTYNVGWWDNTQTGTQTSPAPDTDWHHWVLTHNGTEITLYRDGEVFRSRTIDTTAGGEGNVWKIGNNGGTSSFWDGLVDEIRISSAARSADWIATEYNNHSSPSTFMSLGEESERLGPVLSYKFSEGVGNTAHDSSGYGNTGTLATGTSAPTWQNEDQCVADNCLQFDGTNDYLSVTSDDVNFGTGSFTLSGWFRHSSTPPSSGTDTILARHNTAGWKVYMNTSGYLCFGVDDDSTWGPDASVCTTAALGSLADSRWHHFSAVKTSTTSIAIYIDGMLINEVTSGIPPGSLD